MEKDRLPSLSVAVARDGKFVFAEAYGLADVENSVPASTASVFRIGSVTKTLTSVVLMKLAEEGKIDLDAPIQRWCTAFPEKGALISGRLLLAHQAGIRDYNYAKFREEFLSTRRYESLADALAVFKDDPLVAPPRTKHQYSSYGYVLLGCAIEAAAGGSYADALRRTVLEPSGMASTTLDWVDQVIPHRVRGYGKAADGSWVNATPVDLSDRFSAGGILSTPRDLVAFAGALMSGKLVAAPSLASLWEPQLLAGGGESTYGLGWRVAKTDGEVYHGGTSVGGSAYLYLLPKRNIAIAFATNLELWTEPRHELARGLAKALAP